MSVHILKHGLPLCRFSTRIPNDWPEGDKWISFQDTAGISEHVDCEACLRAHKIPPRSGQQREYRRPGFQ